MAVVFAASLSSTCGCTQSQGRTFGGEQSAISGQISKEELRELLNNFEEFATANVAQAASQLDELQPDFKIRKMSLVHRTRFRQALHTMLERDDPIEAFIETWALSVRITNYFKDGEGSNLFGEHQHVVVTISEKLQTEIERIGKKFLKNKTFIETQRKIDTFAQANPMTGRFSNTILYVTEVEPGKPRLFDDVISIPLSPFKAMTGVDRTASAIYGLRDSANRISDVAEELPESMRWQLLLLLMEMEETEMVKTMLTSMSKFSDSSARFADSAERLPEQLSILVGEIDTKQANLQATLDQAEKTAIAVEHTLVKVNEVSVSLEHTSQSTTEAARAWESAATATTGAIKTWIDKPAKKGTSGSFKIDDIVGAAESVTKAANEISSLTTEIRQLAESDHLTRHIEDVNSRVAGAVDKTALKARALANHLSWRTAQLILLFFALALVYRFLTVRFDNLRKREQQMISADRTGSE